MISLALLSRMRAAKACVCVCQQCWRATEGVEFIGPRYAWAATIGIILSDSHGVAANLKLKSMR